jgi:mannose-1-phosphate guanylyltransferase
MEGGERIPKAVILVGGYGTRLRPLTYTVPKPLVPFANKPILKHQIEALVKTGVKEIILALNYYSELITKEVRRYSDEFSINIVYSKEQEPLGTAGPLALARKHLEGHTFFVLNSDITCEFPLAEMMEFHLRHGREGTILSTQVEDPSRYGLISLERGKTLVRSFVEKPERITTDRINAGIYIFSSTILDRIELRFCSIEREIFPAMAEEKQLHVFDLRGFWMDIGRPQDYLRGQRLYLAHYQRRPHPELGLGSGTLDAERNVVIGKNVRIGKNVQIVNSAVFDGSVIGDNVVIKDSIIGWNVRIEDGVNIDNCSVLGCAVIVESHAILNAVKAQPNKSIFRILKEA